ncbi:hypothetical protein MRX96_016591 [Rhipicephalus microplus]
MGHVRKGVPPRPRPTCQRDLGLLGGPWRRRDACVVGLLDSHRYSHSHSVTVVQRPPAEHRLPAKRAASFVFLCFP